jgi:hypothetical protein
MRYDPIFRYRGWDRKLFIKDKGYQGKVNNHHVIPKQHREHPLLKHVEYDIHGRFNILIMPTKKGKEDLNLHPNTIYHQAHPRYNKSVKKVLDEIYKREDKEYQLWLYVCWLKKTLTVL